jgi:hypothetical protein
VALRNWHSETPPALWEPAVAAALRAFALRHSVRLLFIPFHANWDKTCELNNDQAIISRMRSLIGDSCTAELAHGLRPGQVSAILARCQMVVAMRLHASILAVRNATPFVALDYESKVSCVMKECGLERFVVPLPQDRGECLSQVMETVWAQRGEIRKLLQGVSRERALDAVRHAERLATILQTPPTLRKIDGKTAEFVVRIAREQTLRVGRIEAALQDAADEVRSCRQGIRGLVDAGMFQPALHMLRAWTATSGDAYGEREYLLGYCMQALQQDKSTVLRHYAAALESGFDEFWVRYNRGQLLLSGGDYASGIADLERACFLRPDDCGAKDAFEYWSAHYSARWERSELRSRSRPTRWSI